jgi:hypothetical protein
MGVFLTIKVAGLPYFQTPKTNPKVGASTIKNMGKTTFKGSSLSGN